ncbi:MAG: hypothetical protein JXA10_14095 [Anaerolineae bacterium]|nr:hypothetical protein [Anaerolineae bacterium]
MSVYKTICLGLVVLLLWGYVPPTQAQKTGDEMIMFRAPSGPYPVGRTLFYWIDEARAEIHTAEQNDVRELMIDVWYPA